ncbi:MAG: chemotaxis-specific protein-glutamate methyltransferase CheB [Acidimicrobiales bacterium]
MSDIRVLVVDDSVVVRRLVTDSLESDPDITVVAAAANGKIALSRLEQVAPDLVVLDIEMPELDGLATLSALRATHPTLPVIMFSTLTERGAAATFDALVRGASDYVTKPANVGGVTAARQRIHDELVPKIRALCGRDGRGLPSATPPAHRVPAGPSGRVPVGVPGPRRGADIAVVVVGVSTGGPAALERLFADLLADLPVPVVVVQHMPPLFTEMLAKRLDAKTPMRVAEGVEGMVLAAGQAWVAPGGLHMTVVRDGPDVRLHLHEGPPENSCRPSVDVLFRSAAEVYGPGVLGAVLTGMGQDGLRGSERIVEAGGSVLAQDQASSVVWGMPRFVAEAGLADEVLPIERLGGAIVERVRHGRGGTRCDVAARRVSPGASEAGAGAAGRAAARPSASVAGQARTAAERPGGEGR